MPLARQDDEPFVSGQGVARTRTRQQTQNRPDLESALSFHTYATPPIHPGPGRV